MEAKDILMGLVWKYGWKHTEDTLNGLKEEFVKRSEELKDEMLPPPSLPTSEVKVEEPKTEEVLPTLIENQLKTPLPVNQLIEDKKKKPVNKSKMLQREAERKKREENEAKGIFAADLLTEENLRTWREAKYSNAYIARELVGCREEEVSRRMRHLGLQ